MVEQRRLRKTLIGLSLYDFYSHKAWIGMLCLIVAGAMAYIRDSMGKRL